MIDSAKEFVRLRSSELSEEYTRAAHEEASLQTWRDVIECYPDYKKWVVHNKTIPLEILEELAFDPNPSVRSVVAGKRKISHLIIKVLSADQDEKVRYALACNTKISMEDLMTIDQEGSKWFKQVFSEEIERKKNKLT